MIYRCLNGKRIKCPVCDTESLAYPDYDRDLVFYICPVCDRYQLSAHYQNTKINKNHLASYLCHHRFEESGFEYRYHTTLDKETCDKYGAEFNILAKYNDLRNSKSAAHPNQLLQTAEAQYAVKIIADTLMFIDKIEKSKQ